MSTAAEALAAASAEPFAGAPVAIRERVSFLVADVLAAAVAAAWRRDVAAIRGAVLDGAVGPSTVIGCRDGAVPALAAFANGLPVAAEQLQDGHRTARGHPAAHVVPAVLAAAETVDTEGTAVLGAVLAGCEVGIRVGVAMGGTGPGVHDIGTWGTIGAAAGVAHVLSGGAPAPVAAAIDLAGAFAAQYDATTVFAGATGQHLLLGVAAEMAVVAGSAAAAGARAPAGTLERHFLPLVGARVDPSRLRDGLGARRWLRHRVVDGYVKRHPTCAHLHGVNDAVEDLLDQGPIDPGAVASVVVRTYGAASVFADPAPATDLAARFSIPFTVAVALVAGRLDRSCFSDRWLADPQVRALAGRVEVRHDPALDAGYPDGRPSVVTVTLASGVVREAAAERPRGDGPQALEDPGVRRKPEQLLASAVGPAAAAQVIDAVASLERSGLAPLSTALRSLADLVPPGPEPAPAEPSERQPGRGSDRRQ